MKCLNKKKTPITNCVRRCWHIQFSVVFIYIDIIVVTVCFHDLFVFETMMINLRYLSWVFWIWNLLKRMRAIFFALWCIWIGAQKKTHTQIKWRDGFDNEPISKNWFHFSCVSFIPSFTTLAFERDARLSFHGPLSVRHFPK